MREWRVTDNGGADRNEGPPNAQRGRSAGRIRAAGGANLKEAGEFFDWEPTHIAKTVADFTKDQLLARGWTKALLQDVAEGYEHIARITPKNPSTAGRANQLREIAKLLD
jgi:hypothetical protein